MIKITETPKMSLLETMYLQLTEYPHTDRLFNFDLLYVIADIYEELGQDLNASGIRWARENFKRPSFSNLQNIKWYNEEQMIKYGSFLDSLSNIPDKIFTHMSYTKGSYSYQTIYYCSLQHAYDDLIFGLIASRTI